MQFLAIWRRGLHCRCGRHLRRLDGGGEVWLVGRRSLVKRLSMRASRRCKKCILALRTLKLRIRSPFVRLEVITMRLVRRKKILMMVRGPRCGFSIGLSRACDTGTEAVVLGVYDAGREVDPSLKFDAQLISFPTPLLVMLEPWD